LDQIVEQAISNLHPIPSEYREKWEDVPTIAFTNLVACIPLGGDGKKTAEPSPESIRACAPRLIEFARLANPRLFVWVGELAAKWAPKLLVGDDRLAARRDFKTVKIPHPAFLLRLEAYAQPLAIQRCVVTLADAIGDL
jgi:uracil-DNA glycosylase